MDDLGSSLTNKMNEALGIFSMTQFVNEPTHKNGHTLDLVAYTDTMSVSTVKVVDVAISYHSMVSFTVSDTDAASGPKLPVRHLRKIKSVNIETFTADVNNVLKDVNLSCANDAALGIHNFLAACLDRHAPLLEYKPRDRKSEVWMTPDILVARSKRRSLEKQFHRTKLTIHKEMYVNQVKKVNVRIKQAKCKFYTNRLESRSSNQRNLFDIFVKLTSRGKTITIPTSVPVAELPDLFP
jgi:hypothetical protein